MHRFDDAQRQCDTGQGLSEPGRIGHLVPFVHSAGEPLGLARSVLRQSAIVMSRRARLTVLEHGASAIAWASHYGQGADDCIVVAQQSDESGPQFTERVRQRARRLNREDAHIESVDVYAAPSTDAPSSAARRSVIEELVNQMAAGGHLTLWSAPRDAAGDAELAATLAQFAPILARRQIAMNHQTCEPEARSGVRHAIPTRSGATDRELSYEELA